MVLCYDWSETWCLTGELWCWVAPFLYEIYLLRVLAFLNVLVFKRMSWFSSKSRNQRVSMGMIGINMWRVIKTSYSSFFDHLQTVKSSPNITRLQASFLGKFDICKPVGIFREHTRNFLHILVSNFNILKHWAMWAYPLSLNKTYCPFCLV